MHGRSYFAGALSGRDRIEPSHGLGVLAFALLLAAIARQELTERRRLASAAALAERQRVARDLHDGLAQDLAFIAAHSGEIARSVDAGHLVAAAAQRALALARGTISELSVSQELSAHEALEAVALEQRDRFGIDVDVDSSPDAELSPALRDDVLRIAREAIANAARHGRARSVVVSLTRREGGSELLRVHDDGCGIPAGESRGMFEGFGLRTMRERAAGFGGALRIDSANRYGTELEVTLP
jgi:signal transduction histidine kinase